MITMNPADNLPGNLPEFFHMVPPDKNRAPMFVLLIYVRSTATTKRIAEVLKQQPEIIESQIRTALGRLRTDSRFHERFHRARCRLPEARFH